MSKIIKTIKLLLICLLPLVASQTKSQISEYYDCTELNHLASKFGRPLSIEEKVHLVESNFYANLSNIKKCEDQIKSNTSSSSSSNNSVTISTASEGSSNSQESNNSLSRNALKDGEKSIAITGNLNQGPKNNLPSGTLVDGQPAGSQGATHKALDKADNRSILKAQIKSQIDAEEDPEIKRLLQEQYEAIK